jgi:hypothetical protein
MTLVLTHPLTEMSTRKLPGGKGQLARKADNLTAICELSRKCGILNISQPYGPPQPVTGVAFTTGNAQDDTLHFQNFALMTTSHKYIMSCDK